MSLILALKPAVRLKVLELPKLKANLPESLTLSSCSVVYSVPRCKSKISVADILIPNLYLHAEYTADVTERLVTAINYLKKILI